MHCHTVFSVDGMGTPEDLVDAAAERGVKTLSITEHNSVGSYHRASNRARERGIRYLPGVEVDAFFQGRSYHFVAFGFDPGDPAFLALQERQRENYVVRFEIRFEKMRALGFPCSLEEIKTSLPVSYPTHPNQALSPWALTRFIDRHSDPEGLVNYMRDAKQALQNEPRPALAPPKPGQPAERGQFCSYEEARDLIHRTGGVLLLAHVGKVLARQPEAQIQLIRQLMDQGMDGFELYHPFNRDEHDINRDGPPVFEGLRRLGEELGCVLSGGSDCHRAPGEGDRELGACGAPLEMLRRMDEVLEDRAGQRAG